MSIGIEIRGNAEKGIKKMIAKLNNPGDFWNRVGIKMERSVKKNFRDGGRPKMWKKSLRAADEDGQTLVDTGRLRASIRWGQLVGNDGIVIGTPVEYAEQHQEGFRGLVALPARSRTVKRFFTTKSGKESKRRRSETVTTAASTRRVNIPKRPFLLVQKEDVDGIEVLLHKLLEEN